MDVGKDVGKGNHHGGNLISLATMEVPQKAKNNLLYDSSM